jgi:hypothetical protein
VRTASEIRAHFIAELANAVRRPSMYGGEPHFITRLWDLAFIDDQKDAFNARRDELRAARIFVSTGVRGWFQTRFPALDPDGEVASVYARLADLFGWFAVERRLDEDEFARATNVAAELARTDVTSAEVVAELGPPSVVAGDVRAYAGPASSTGWLYFDYDFEPYGPGHYARDGAPPTSYRLRAVRMPSSKWYWKDVLYTPRGRGALAD